MMRFYIFLITLYFLTNAFFFPNQALAIGSFASLDGKELLSGKEFSLKFDSNDSVTVIVFLSSQCPCSASHLPKLIEMAKKYSEKKINFIGIHSNVDESEKQSREYFSNSKIPFPVIQDQKNKIADQFGALKTPHVFVVKNKKILFEGGVDNSRIAENADKNYLADALESILSGREPSVKESRTLGCVIKRE